MSNSVIDRMGRQVPQVSKKEFESLKRIIGKTKNHVPLTHDLSIPEEYDFVVRQHGGEEFLALHYPAILHMLKVSREHAHALHTQGRDPRQEHQTLTQLDNPPTNEWLTTNTVGVAGFLAPNITTFQATGVSAVLDGTFISAATMTLYDMTQGVMVAQESVPNLYNGGKYVTIWAQGDVGAVGNLAQATFTISYMPQGGTTLVSQTIPVQVNQVCPLASPTVTAPVHTATPVGQPIKVALNRTQQQQPDCDYYYTTPPSGQRTPNVGIQVSGSASFQAGLNVCTPFTFGTNLKGQLLLVSRTNGGAALALTNAQFQSGITGNGSTLAWNWGANNIFGAAPWDQNQTIDLILNMNVAVSANCASNPQPNALVTVTSVANAVTDNCTTKIDPLTFVWGCLAAESMVIMADGSQKPIIDVQIGERVLCETDGSIAEVVNRILGYEDREPCVQIFAGGRSVTTSSEHPMLTPEGPIRACDLIIGQSILTLEGAVRSVDIRRIWYGNQVVNLKLKLLQGEPTRWAKAIDGCSHFADGFLVGDAVMQGSLIERGRADEQDLERILRSVPKEYHLDVVNRHRSMRGEELLSV